MAVKPWVWVVVGIAGVCVLGLFMLAAAGMYFFAHHVETTTLTRDRAEQVFEDARAPFAKQRPLIEVDDDDHVHRVNLDRERPAGAQPPQDLHVLAFDPDDEKVVRLTIPFWLLKLGDSGSIDLGPSRRRIDLGGSRLQISDLERFGPTLILDHRGSNGERVLVWSQ